MVNWLVRMSTPLAIAPCHEKLNTRKSVGQHSYSRVN